MLFFQIDEDVLVTQIFTYIVRFGWLATIVVAIPFISSLWFGFNWLLDIIGIYAWFVVLYYGVAGIATLYLFYSMLIRRSWEKMTVPEG